MINNSKINHFKFGKTEKQYEYSIGSKAGCLVLYDCKDYLYINYKNLRLNSKSWLYITQDDYIIFDYEDTTIEFDVECITKDCQDYDSLILNIIDDPSIILHRDCIQTLEIINGRGSNIYHKPTESLSLKFAKNCSHVSTTLIEFIKSHCMDELNSEVNFDWWNLLELSEFDNLVQAVFDNLTIKKLIVSGVGSKLMASQLFDKIKHCHSLQCVKFNDINDAHGQLDVIEANLNVKHWTIDFENKTISTSAKERLQKMLSDRNDNSLIVSSKNGELNDIPQISQQFKISPVIYC